SFPRPWTCTSHFRRKSTSACPPRPIPRKSLHGSTALPRSPRLKPPPANQKSASTFAPHRLSSTPPRPLNRNNRRPVPRALPSLPALARPGKVRSSASASPEKTSHPPAPRSVATRSSAPRPPPRTPPPTTPRAMRHDSISSCCFHLVRDHANALKSREYISTARRG